MIILIIIWIFSIFLKCRRYNFGNNDLDTFRFSLNKYRKYNFRNSDLDIFRFSLNKYRRCNFGNSNLDGHIELINTFENISKLPSFILNDRPNHFFVSENNFWISEFQLRDFFLTEFSFKRSKRENKKNWDRQINSGIDN